MEQLRRIVKEEGQKMVSARAVLEREISDLQTRLRLVDPQILEVLNINIEEFTCRHHFPSMYEEVFSLEEYDRDKEKYILVLKGIDEIRNQLILAAKKGLGLIKEDENAFK